MTKEKFTRISLSIDTELLKDINFAFAKKDGQDPKNSYGKIFYQLLRPVVPDRNSQVTGEAIESNASSNSSQY